MSYIVLCVMSYNVLGGLLQVSSKYLLRRIVIAGKYANTQIGKLVNRETVTTFLGGSEEDCYRCMQYGCTYINNDKYTYSVPSFTVFA